MNGMRTCATCRYFKPMTMMSKEERRMFMDDCRILGIKDPENYGYCVKFQDNIIIRRKDNGKRCKYWEVKK